MRPRRQARNLALQALFEVDAVGHDPETVLQHRFDEVELSPEYQRFARSLMWGTLNHKEQLDTLISKHASAWPLNEIAILDRNILRMAIFELLFENTTPARVAINEAIELAKRYGNESTRRFVNGVLGAVVTELEQTGRLGKATSNRLGDISAQPMEPKQ